MQTCSILTIFFSYRLLSLLGQLTFICLFCILSLLLNQTARLGLSVLLEATSRLLLLEVEAISATATPKCPKFLLQDRRSFELHVPFLYSF
ncbi:hypothetical protein PAHAL_5G454800 [Panicum hallii]|uniref:Uncharacterized protein n=1 Tax=Panicum hallii TaxID=206008 RepID=A0A2S3HXC0_9POAL|nr:hypothetical protein PAHAL_5G454800 [Panicum hallii]